MGGAEYGPARSEDSASAFFQSSCGRLSPRSRQPAATSSAASCGPTYFVTPTSVISSALTAGGFGGAGDALSNAVEIVGDGHGGNDE